MERRRYMILKNYGEIGYSVWLDHAGKNGDGGGERENQPNCNGYNGFLFEKFSYFDQF